MTAEISIPFWAWAPVVLMAFALGLGFLMWHGPDEQFFETWQERFARHMSDLTVTIGATLISAIEPIGHALNAVAQAIGEPLIPPELREPGDAQTEGSAAPPAAGSVEAS